MEALSVPSDLTRAWHALGPSVRGYLGRFLTLAASPPPPPDRVAAEPAAAPPFHADLVSGAPRLRAAFPGLRRTLVAVDRGDERRGDPLEVRIACEGAHEGPFFDFMLATRREVRFVESHRLRVRDGRIVEDHISIDLRAIIRQLAVLSRP